MQAAKIIELRPYVSIEDFNTKLGQGKKRAGPAGISPRMFEDSTEIFKGYGKVDNILEDCENIGNSLKKEISSWSHEKVKSKEAEAGSSRNSPDSGSDGALSLTHVQGHKPKYYMTAQPSLLLEDVKLKEYQMIGVNWLSLLYQKSLSCILADEMGMCSLHLGRVRSLTVLALLGLGKTVQVISFFAHLKERGRNGPHLIVVPYVCTRLA